MNKNIFLNVTNEIRNRQERADRLRQQRKIEIYNKIPEIIEIDQQIIKAGFTASKMAIGKGSVPASDMKKQVDEIINVLRAQKIHKLIQEGFPENYLEDVYTCDKCSDKGYIEVNGICERYSCHKQLLINALLANSNVNINGDEDFSHFNLEYYPNDENLDKYGIPISPRRNMELILFNCMNFVENFNETNQSNIIFIGTSGLGKTFLCNAIAIALLKKGLPVVYISASELFSKMLSYGVDAKDRSEQNDLRDMILDSELLIIDDLGTEKQTESRYSELLEILNYREIKNKKSPCRTIIATNLNVKNIYKYYGERVGSRILGSFNAYRFIGDDIRLKKKINH
jgi:DNA replication protein DnaC